METRFLRYLDTIKTHHDNLAQGIFAQAIQIEEEKRKELLNRKGPENIHKLHDELSDWMLKYTTLIRENKNLSLTLNKIKELRERQKKITLDDKTRIANQTYTLASQFDAMLEVALVIVKGALLRNESRGSHYKPEFPHRDNKNFLKTTIAEYRQDKDEPEISYQKVDLRYVEPEARDYTKHLKEIPEFKNLPKNIPLPV